MFYYYSLKHFNSYHYNLSLCSSACETNAKTAFSCRNSHDQEKTGKIKHDDIQPHVSYLIINVDSPWMNAAAELENRVVCLLREVCCCVLLAGDRAAWSFWLTRWAWRTWLQLFWLRINVYMLYKLVVPNISTYMVHISCEPPVYIQYINLQLFLLTKLIMHPWTAQ